VGDHVPAGRGDQVARLGLVPQQAAVVQRVDVEPAAGHNNTKMTRQIFVLFPLCVPAGGNPITNVLQLSLRSISSVSTGSL
jgi:hypothetical protein